MSSIKNTLRKMLYIAKHRVPWSIMQMVLLQLKRERERVYERLRSISWLCLTRCQFPDAALVVARM